MVDGDQDGTTAVEAAFGAYLGEAAVRADRLRAEAARGLVLAVRQAAARGWSQRRIAAALGRSQPEVARLLRRADAVPPAVDVAPARREVVVDGAPGDGHGGAPPGERADGPPPETVLNRVLGSQRDAIVAAAGRHGMSNVRVFGSVARGEDGPESDVDLLVDLEPGVSLFDLGRAQVELEQILDRPVDLVPARMLKPRVAATVEAVAL
ncbi:nucleotidyltransferase domain-containing protein [Cellulomonas sp. Y8]|uniref:nucleotidyltransferase domain-containing protein n=1 Tax=Cellulomonas sp. Y8 TaxID=2591145 RepID=UPI003D72048E